MRNLVLIPLVALASTGVFLCGCSAAKGGTLHHADPIQQGHSCSSHLECDEDAFICEHSIGIGFDDPFCVEIGKEGPGCILTDDCAEGLFCDYQQKPPSCKPRKATGQSCSGALSKECRHGLVCIDAIYKNDPAICSEPGKQGDHCDMDDDCAADHYCFGWAGPGRTCKQKLPEGADCDSDKECLPGLYCDDCVEDHGVCTVTQGKGSECSCDKACVYPFVCATSEETPTCKPRSGPGGNCARDLECMTGLVCSQLSTPGECRERGSEGELCARREECAPGLACRYTSQVGDAGSCKPGIGEGDACDGNLDCATGMGCNKGYSPPQCKPPAAVEQACSSKEDCAAGLTCMGHLCRKPGNKGDTCLYTHDCGENLYCDKSPDQSVCMPVKGEGGPCSEDEQCGLGFSCSIYAKPPVCVPSEDPGWTWEDESGDD